MINLTPIAEIIKSIAEEEILPRFASTTRSIKADGSIVTEADLITQQRLQQELAQLHPEFDFLGEEMDADEQHAKLISKNPVWCLDPLDGTSNFAAGIGYFCISLSLIDEGKVRAAIVYDPIRDELFMADDIGASLNGQTLLLKSPELPLKRCIALVDFKRLSKNIKHKLIDEPPYASQRSFGSVALDWCWLAAGRVHLYLHGRSNIWDYSAGNYIFTKAGGPSCTLEGEEIFVAEMAPRSCVGAVDGKLFTEWKSFLNIV